METTLPPGVTRTLLPSLMMDQDFKDFLPQGMDLPTLEAQRTALLLETLETTAPDVFLVELFPFGRKRFAFELVPALERFAAMKRTRGHGAALCSVRDILVEKSDQAKFERRALGWLNEFFDGVLVHADPRLVRFEETFARMEAIVPEIVYTGYVTEPPPLAEEVESLRASLGLTPVAEGGAPLVVASAGGGAVGGDVVAAAVEACALLETPHQCRAFAGPFATDETMARLARLTRESPHVHVARFTDCFPTHLAVAQLSVSMAGYNTTMALLAAGTYGLVHPFDQNREQRMRATRLVERGAVGMLEREDLHPPRLAARMAAALRSPRTTAHGVDLDGAAASARAVARFASLRHG